MLEQSDDVGEGFVKCRHVEIGALRIARMKSVEQRVRRFMRYDIVRDDAENARASSDAAAVIGRLEIAEEQRDLVRIIVGIRFPQGVGINP